MIKKLKNLLFCDKADSEPPRRLVQGCSITPEPDEAELAAQAILEIMAGLDSRENRNNQDTPGNQTPRSSEYYLKLANRVRQAHADAKRRATRYVAFCEQELRKKDIPIFGKNSIAQMEVELYKRLDVVEREDGELKRRWQHCLAEVTVRMMQANQVQDVTDEPENH